MAGKTSKINNLINDEPVVLSLIGLKILGYILKVRNTEDEVMNRQ